MADYRVGTIRSPATPLADAAAASAAFPPVLSPFALELEDAAWETVDGNDLTGREYRDRVALADGGVYDNLGLETVWKRCQTVLVSDGGGRMADDPDPPADWARQSIRVLKVVDNQVRDLRKRQILDAYRSGARLAPIGGSAPRSTTSPAPTRSPLRPSGRSRWPNCRRAFGRSTLRSRSG